MTPTPILITGSQRSGTTLLRLILDSHPAVCTIDEAEFDGDMDRQLLDAAPGTTAVAFKLPAAAHQVEAFCRLSGARVLWCQRTHLDVVASMLELQLAYQDAALSWANHELGGLREVASLRPALERHGYRAPAAWEQALMRAMEKKSADRDRTDGLNVASYCWWAKSLLATIYKDVNLPLHIVQYEELVGDPANRVRELLEFCGLTWRPEVLCHHELHSGYSIGGTSNTRAIDRHSVDRWRGVLSDAEADEVTSRCATKPIGRHLDDRPRADRYTAPAPQPHASMPNDQPRLHVTTSRQFLGWMADVRASIAFTTYQAGKLFWLGLDPDARLSVFERTLERVMGLAVDDQDLYVSTLYQLWRFRNALLPGQQHNGFDRVYMPRASHVTGDIDIHDIAIESSGRVVFVSTQFNCIATTHPDHSFEAVWRPPWISTLTPEDRCHLNGLSLRDGALRYATSVSRSDVSDGWRDRRRDSGVVVDITTNEIVCEGLSMPHSPRWHNGRLYLLDSGSGYIGYVDQRSGRFEPIAFVPGYARGLALIDRWAIVGLSDRRENRTFQDLPLEDELARRDADTRCGLHIVDLESGQAPHWVRIEGVVSELYDVVALPGARRPMGVGFVSDEVRRMISPFES